MDSYGEIRQHAHSDSRDYQTDYIRTLIVRASHRLKMYLYAQNRNAALTRNDFRGITLKRSFIYQYWSFLFMVPL